jgi:hypothetical protein
MHWWVVVYHINTGTLYVLCSMGWKKNNVAESIKRYKSCVICYLQHLHALITSFYICAFLIYYNFFHIMYAFVWTHQAVWIYIHCIFLSGILNMFVPNNVGLAKSQQYLTQFLQRLAFALHQSRTCTNIKLKYMWWSVAVCKCMECYYQKCFFAKLCMESIRKI